MTDTPFWKRPPSAPESDPQTLAEPTSDARKPGDVLTIGGHEFAWTEGVQAKVELQDDTGSPLGVVHIPYDPGNQPSEEDVLAEATRLYHDMEYIRAIVREDVVAQLAAEIHKSGTAQSMINLVAEGLTKGRQSHPALRVVSDQAERSQGP